MEANIPSELDIAGDLFSGSAGDEAPELDDTLISSLYRFSSGKRELIATVLKILAIGIIERGNLSLGGTVPLQGKGHIVVLRREQRRVGNPGGKASGQISDRPLEPGVQCYLSFHTHDFIAGIQIREGLILSLATQIGVTSLITDGLVHSHRREHIRVIGDASSEGFNLFNPYEGVVTVPASAIGLPNRSSSLFSICLYSFWPFIFSCF